MTAGVVVRHAVRACCPFRTSREIATADAPRPCAWLLSVHLHPLSLFSRLLSSPLARRASRRPTLKSVLTTTSIEPRPNLLTPLFTAHYHRALSNACFACRVRVVALHVTFLNPQTRAVGCRRVADRVMGIRRRLVCCMLHGQCDAPCPQSMHHNTSTTDVCRLSYWHYARDCSSQLRIPAHLRCRHIFPFIIPSLTLTMHHTNLTAWPQDSLPQAVHHAQGYHNAM